MNHQNWETVNLGKQKSVAPNVKKVAKQNVNNNLTSVKCEKIYDPKDPDAEPEIKPVKVTRDFGKEIAKARLAKQLTQKQLANQLCIPHNFITEYEMGKGVYNINYINKIKKFINQ
jgi:ribosome-binding protein aMBF1 (putative translation factor)